MEITGRLIKILPEQRGESARGAWVRGGFVIETDDTYPKQVAFNMFGEDRLATLQTLSMNGMVQVTFSPESREYNERWYTDLRCIRVQPIIPGQMPTAPVAQQPTATTATTATAAPFASAPAAMPSDGNDDLPF